MKQVSFEGIGQVLATFQVGEGVVEGHTVRVSGNGMVEPCTAGRVKLSADASGGMKTDEEGGTPYLVAEADTTAGTIAVLL